MANSLSANLLLDTFSERMETTLGPVLAPLSAFAKDFTDAGIDAVMQTKSLQIPVFNSATAVLTNPTNFESGDTNNTNASITVNHLSKPFFLTSAQLNQKYKIEQLMDINWQVFANKLIDVALTPVTTTNFGANNVVVTQANITGATLQIGRAHV